MLVVISDIHLTDDGFSKTIPAQAFRIFRERLRDMAYDASWRADGVYRPIEQLDVVLLGDILDVIRSERWPMRDPGDPEYVRPWSGADDARFQAQVQEIVNAILEANEPALQVLRSFSQPGVITLPPATRDGRVARVSREPDASERVPVEVRLRYVVGNHDWFLHLPGAAFDRVRRQVIERMGLRQPDELPFPHRPEDWPELAELCERHRVYLRHGDFFDVWNFHGDRRRSSIGDAIVIDLLNRFCVTVGEQLGDRLPKECLAGLRQIDHVRPLLLAPVWVDALLRRTVSDAALVEEVKRIWDRTADDFLQLEFVRDCARHLPALTLDKLALALKFSQGLSLHWLGQLFSWFSARMPCSNERPNAEDALQENALHARDARLVVYGHTHQHEIVPLEVTATAEGPARRFYLNTGTWRVLHHRALRERDIPDFTPHWVMTYVGVFQGDERGGRPFEVWSGALALPASEPL